MKIRCIALDLDGTTLNRQGKLSKRNREALEQAAAEGICIAVASGRSYDSLPAEVLSVPGVRYAITSNGAAVCDLKTGARLMRRRMTQKSAEEILAQTAEYDVPFEAFVDGKPYAQREYVEDPVRFGASPRAIGYIQGTREPVEDMREFIRQHKNELDSIDVVAKSEPLKKELWIKIAENVSDVYLTSSVPQLLEIAHKDAGKENAALFLLEHLGLKREELAAFGDAHNDIGLLKLAGIGFAVANASPDCLAAADRIVSSNEEDGVAEGIFRILE